MQTTTQQITEQNEPMKSLDKSAIVAIYETHHEAEDAIRELQKSGFDMQQLSIVGKD